MNYQEFKDLVFETAKANGLTEYELYYKESQSTELGAFGGEINAFSSSDSAEAGLRCVCGGHIGYASTSLFTAEEADSLVERAMENALSMEKEEPVLFCKGGLEYREVNPRVVEDIPTSQMVEIALKALQCCREADERVTASSMTSAVIQHSTTCLDNSNGVHLQNTTHVGAVIPQVIVTEGGETCDAHDFKLGNLHEADLEKLAKETVQKALDKMGAGVPDSGKYPLVLSNSAMSSLLGVFSSAFSAENAQNGLSLMKGKEGTQIAAECVTLLDNPFYEESFRQSSFDAEGTPAKCKAVVDKGVLTTLLHNLATAAKAGVESTGNASRGSVDSPITVRPTNFYFQPGEYTAEELYEKAGEGVLVTGLGGLHAGADFVTGDFSLQSSGFMIRGGKKAEPVKSFTIAGNFYQMLKDITALGNDMELGLSCIGSPSVLVSEITVAGK
ncbi:MAG: TldD/PmbA family protein [Lachnospiraceae bacterium]|nr:TldD/PmbA family protein [Lachnospiraceae bacterium]